MSHSTWRHATPHQLVNELTQLLTGAGLKVFLDRFALKGEAALFKSLRQAIEDSTVGVLVVTAAAMKSSWVQLELELMLRRRHSGRMCLVALFLENCPGPAGVKFDAEVSLLGRRDLFPASQKIKEAVLDCVKRLGRGD